MSELIDAAKTLRDAVDGMKFAPPVTHVYNPLVYAWPAHEAYLRRVGWGRKRAVLLGMNPGPWGMAQTGVPFGEIAAARDWLGINTRVGRPQIEHPKRPVLGFDCDRSEVSGRRLWGLFRDRFDTPEAFFAEHMVSNYCPLVFMEEGGRNRTPDKLPAPESGPLFEACDEHLRRVVAATRPRWLVAVGTFAEKRAAVALGDSGVEIVRILHPSPASPAANRDWAGTVTRQLEAAGVW